MSTAQGFAYVQFGSREALESAIALDGADFQKRKLIIAESRPPPTSSGERGGRGGRGRGRHDNFGGGRGHQHEYDRGDHRQGSHSYAGQSDGHFAAAPGAGHRHQLDVADAGESQLQVLQNPDLNIAEPIHSQEIASQKRFNNCKRRSTCRLLHEITV